MSGIPYLFIATRSIPIPQAKPLHRSGSYPTASRTAGSTTPHPSSSIQPVRLQAGHPSPPHRTHRMSSSAEGSVNWK